MNVNATNTDEYNELQEINMAYLDIIQKIACLQHEEIEIVKDDISMVTNDHHNLQYKVTKLELDISNMTTTH